MPLDTKVGLGPGHIVLHDSPQFSAHVCCDQTATWIKMALGMEVDLGPCHIVLEDLEHVLADLKLLGV